MHVGAYYREKLSAQRLFRCYEIAPSRIRQYLEAEIEFVAANVKGVDVVLELGCGYGRVMKALSPHVSRIVGNDISKESLKLAKLYMEPCGNFGVVQMDASNLGFCPFSFDAVFCVQNGISAFGVDNERLVGESLRVTKKNGVVLFSSYSPKIWKHRLEWFRRQSQCGLLGEIDEEKTGDGTIVCKDGFTATTVSGEQFAELFDKFGHEAMIVEVDESSVFCRVIRE
jgi:2-polyprenyl-6-hydroxyphenyl methylase/3-demethylubiquinone-9 3-methyltransferase